MLASERNRTTLVMPELRLAWCARSRPGPLRSH
jgi:hypothetical protein